MFLISTYLLIMWINYLYRGAADLNDMKDMLANLPQYQEQREKVFVSNCVIYFSLLIPNSLSFSLLVLSASEHGPRLHGHI